MNDPVSPERSKSNSKQGSKPPSTAPQVDAKAADAKTMDTVIESVRWVQILFKGMLSASLLTHVFIMTFVIPRFELALEEMNSDMPVYTQVLFSISSYWWLWLLIVVVNIALIFKADLFDKIPVLLGEIVLVGIWTAYVYITLFLPYLILLENISEF